MSFSYHVLFPLKQSCRDVVLCQLYLQLNCQSMLPCGECRQWNLQAPFPALYYCRSTEHVFALCSLFFSFFFIQGLHSRLPFVEARKNKFKSRLSHPRGSFSLSRIMATITEDIGLGCMFYQAQGAVQNAK